MTYAVHQPGDLSGICRMLPGYAKCLLCFIIPVKDEVDGMWSMPLMTVRFSRGQEPPGQDFRCGGHLLPAQLPDLLSVYPAIIRRVDPPREVHRKQEYKRKAACRCRTKDETGAAAPIARHKCAVCGRTETDKPGTGIPFLLEMRRQLRILSGSSVYTRAHQASRVQTPSNRGLYSGKSLLKSDNKSD